MTNDNSLQTSSLTIHNDLSNNGTFGSSFVYDNSLSVTGSVVVVDASNTIMSFLHCIFQGVMVQIHLW